MLTGRAEDFNTEPHVNSRYTPSRRLLAARPTYSHTTYYIALATLYPTTTYNTQLTGLTNASLASYLMFYTHTLSDIPPLT